MVFFYVSTMKGTQKKCSDKGICFRFWWHFLGKSNEDVESMFMSKHCKKKEFLKRRSQKKFKTWNTEIQSQDRVTNKSKPEFAYFVKSNLICSEDIEVVCLIVEAGVQSHAA